MSIEKQRAVIERAAAINRAAAIRRTAAVAAVSLFIAAGLGPANAAATAALADASAAQAGSTAASAAASAPADAAAATAEVTSASAGTAAQAGVTAAADPNLTVISPRNVNYNTETAFIGTLERSAGFDATLAFTNTQSVLMPKDGIFSSMNVKSNDMVEKGDVLATFTVNADELAIDEASLALELAETTQRREVDALTATLEAARVRLAEFGGAATAADTDTAAASVPATAADTAVDPERRLAELAVEAAEENLDFTVYNGERNLAGMRERLDALLADSEDFTVTAPISGIVYDIVYFTEGRSVARGEFLFNMSEPSAFQILVGGAGLNQLRLGAEVTIETSRRDAPDFPGHVIGNTILIGVQEADADAVIAFDDPQSFIDFAEGSVDRVSGLRYRVMIDISDITNVLLVPRRAVTTENTYRYVTLLEDGLPKKRYVLVGLWNIEYSQILDGIEAGDELIIN